MTVKIKVLTRSGLNVDQLIDHAKHADEIDPHGSSRFEAIDDGHNITFDVRGSGFNYLADIPISGSVREITVDKGSTHQLEVDFSPTVKVSTVLGGSKLESYIGSQVILFTGNNGADIFESGRKADTLKGLGGNDRLDGNFGNDKMEGGNGNDRLAGDNGNDLLTGGLGKDSQFGGLGGDRFDFNTIGETKVGALRDTIGDFHSSQGDKIDLRGIDANTTVGGNQAFVTFLGAGAFTNTPGQLRISGGILQGDVNGDSVADFEIKVVGAVSGGDFLL